MVSFNVIFFYTVASWHAGYLSCYVKLVYFQYRERIPFLNQCVCVWLEMGHSICLQSWERTIQRCASWRPFAAFEWLILFEHWGQHFHTNAFGDDWCSRSECQSDTDDPFRRQYSNPRTGIRRKVATMQNQQEYRLILSYELKLPRTAAGPWAICGKFPVNK